MSATGAEAGNAQELRERNRQLSRQNRELSTKLTELRRAKSGGTRVVRPGTKPVGIARVSRESDPLAIGTEAPLKCSRCSELETALAAAHNALEEARAAAEIERSAAAARFAELAAAAEVGSCAHVATRET